MFVADYVLMDYGTGAAHGGARPTTSATSTSPRRSTCRSARSSSPAGERRGAPAGAGRYVEHSEDEVAGQLRRVRRPHRARGDREDHRLARRAGPGRGRPSTTACATGCSAASATGAPRSRSSTATTCGMVPVPEDQLPVAAPRHRGLRAQGREPARRRRGLGQHRVPEVRRPGQARDRHDGHLRRLLLVLPALPRPAQRRRALGPRRRRLLDAGRPVHRRRRARDPAPDVRALLLQGAQRHGPTSTSRSRSRTSSRRG